MLFWRAIVRALLISVLLISGIARASADDWIKIGSTTADRSGNVTVVIKDANGQRFKAVRVATSPAGVEITKVTISPGGIIETASGATHAVQLGSSGRIISSLTVAVRSSLATGSRFTVDVYGLPAQQSEAKAPASGKKKKKAASPTAARNSASDDERAPGSGGLGIGGTGEGGGGMSTGRGIGSIGAGAAGATMSRRYEYRAEPQPAPQPAPAPPPPPPASAGSAASEPQSDVTEAAPPPASAGSAAPEPQSDVTEAAPPPAAAPPPSDEPAPAAAAPPSPAANVCQDKKVCTPVGVFFGTDRDPQQNETRVVFGAGRNDKLTLGHAFVTVPKARKTGEIPLPTLWDIYVRRVPESGDPARHFTIPPGGISLYRSEDDFIAAVKQNMAAGGAFKDHAFVFIHGFRVGFDEALFRTAQIAYDLSPDGVPFGTAFLYSWPSAADASAYLFDEDSARLAIPHLERFLRLVIDKTGAKHIHLIAHSMGNVPLINALKTVMTAENKPRINQVVLAAPDFDRKEFEKVVAAIEPVAKGFTLYASSTDYAMKLARKARREPRAGDATTPPGPAIVGGIDTVDVSALDTSIFSWNHDNYAESKELLNDMSLMFRTGERPPSARNLNFKPQNTDAGTYWRYTK